MDDDKKSGKIKKLKSFKYGILERWLDKHDILYSKDKNRPNIDNASESAKWKVRKIRNENKKNVRAEIKEIKQRHGGLDNLYKKVLKSQIKKDVEKDVDKKVKRFKKEQEWKKQKYRLQKKSVLRQPYNRPGGICGGGGMLRGAYKLRKR